MAIDYGDARTGVALSDVTRTLCGGAFVIEEPSMKKLAARLAEEAAARGADTVVLGNPLNMNGTAGPRAEKTARLKALLEGRGLAVTLWDERRTTVEAERVLIGAGRSREKRKTAVDAVAASLILEGFLLRENQ